MEFNEWIIFIKESRNWYANKYQSTDYCLIKRYDNDNDDDIVIDIVVMSVLWCLWDDSVRILLTSWISARHRVREIMNDCAYYIEKVFIKSSRSELNLWRNLSNVCWLYRLVWAICLMKVNLILRL